ncbi:MAG: PP2C family protein-serine/threonine phosphatase, partial [Verrucomicrobiota bacterium]
MNFNKVFNKWLHITFTIPLLLVIIIVNLIIFLKVSGEIDKSLEGINDTVIQKVDGRLEPMPEAVLFELGSHKKTAVDLLIPHNKNRIMKPEDRKKLLAKLDEDWKNIDNLPEDHPYLDTFMKVNNNAVSRTLRNIQHRFPWAKNIILVDKLGELVAALKPPERFNYSNDAWVLNSEKTPFNDQSETSTVYSEGINEHGKFGLSLALFTARIASEADYPRKGLIKHLQGTYYVEIDPQKLELPTPVTTDPKQLRLMSALNGQTSFPLKGAPELFATNAPLLTKVDYSKANRGWMGKNHFESKPLKTASIFWVNNVSVVSMRAEERFDLAQYGVLFQGAAVSIGILLILIYWAKVSGPKTLFAPVRILLEAGYWSVQRAHKSQNDSFKMSTDVSAYLTTPRFRTTGVKQDLDNWFRATQREFRQQQSDQDEEVSKDLDVAHEFQMAYLNRPYPKIPEVHVRGRPRLQFYHRYNPALALGGDFFNILPLGPDCACVMIADVMGHGTRSALITSILRTLMSDLSHQGRNARHLMTEMNKQFYDMLKTIPNPLFASAFYFVADLTSKAGTFASAGHPAPFHLRRSAGKIAQMKVPEPHGAALGVIPDEEYSGGHCRLIPGDVFIFFTDGVMDVNNPQFEEFGLKRLEDVIRKNAFKEVEGIVDTIFEELFNFADSEPIMDDLCVVALEVTTAEIKTASSTSSDRKIEDDASRTNKDRERG